MKLYSEILPKCMLMYFKVKTTTTMQVKHPDALRRRNNKFVDLNFEGDARKIKLNILPGSFVQLLDLQDFCQGGLFLPAVNMKLDLCI